MNLSQAQLYRLLAGKAGLILGILLVAAMLDVVIARHRTDFNVMHVRPGQVEPIDGPLAEKTSVEDLTYQSDSPDLQVVFDETHAGFWLGGQMWRGQLKVGTQIRPGKYTLSVMPKNPVSDRPPLVYRVTVYGDRYSWQQSSKSYLTRYSGLSPWWVIAFSFGSLVLFGGLIFLLSGRVDALMARSGKAEVYRVRRVPNGYEIGFGLGTDHRVHPGAKLTLYNQDGLPLGRIEVVEASAQDAVAVGEFNQEIQVGFLVSQDDK
jgi:hypothetical protein